MDHSDVSLYGLFAERQGTADFLLSQPGHFPRMSPPGRREDVSQEVVDILISPALLFGPQRSLPHSVGKPSSLAVLLAGAVSFKGVLAFHDLLEARSTHQVTEGTLAVPRDVGIVPWNATAPLRAQPERALEPAPGLCVLGKECQAGVLLGKSAASLSGREAFDAVRNDGLGEADLYPCLVSWPDENLLRSAKVKNGCLCGLI